MTKNSENIPTLSNQVINEKENLVEAYSLIDSNSINLSDTIGYKLSYYSLVEDIKVIKENKREKVNFSLIIPVFQEEKIIESTLKLYTSELRKKYNFEIIISDGGSIDHTLKIAMDYADTILTFDRDRKQTIAEGRNIGAIFAKSDNLIFLNIDSIPENIDDFFSKIHDWADNKSDLSEYKALSCFVKVFENERKLKDNLFYFALNTYFKFLNFIGIGMARGECIIIKRQTFDEFNGFNSKLVAGEDFDLFHRVSKKYKTIFTSQITILESPRRFRQKGYLRTLYAWFLNSISVLFIGKSHSKDWEPIR